MTSSPQPGQRAIVTGGAGFLGSHLCERLITCGVQVICMDNFITGTASNVAQFVASPLFTAATPQALAHGQELAADVEDLDWDEYSIWGSLSGEGIAAEDLMIHHGDLPLNIGGTTRLCARMAAIGLSFPGGDQELTRRLAAFSHAELVPSSPAWQITFPRRGN